MIKGVLLDYGGTIDTNGLHWANVLWDSYEKYQAGIDRALFWEAYKFGERALAIKPLVKPHHNFHDVLFLKVTEQFQFLQDQGISLDNALIEQIAADCNVFAQATVNQAEITLKVLAEQYPLVMVSNFYGNLNQVLTGFGIRKYFDGVIESAVAGVRKPDPQIYQLGVDAHGFAPESCAVIGDSYTKDILPGKQVGCKTLWLNVKGWEDSAESVPQTSEADIEIADFSETIEALSRLS